jgi:ligand-binding sensor domain-containing protein
LAWFVASIATCPALHALNPANSIFQYNCRSWPSADGFKLGRINSIAEGQDGYLWMATQNGLIRFDGKEFKSFPIATEGNKGRAVDSVSIAADGGLWLSLSMGGFGSFDGSRLTLTNDIPGEPQSTPSNVVMVASDGSIWTGSMNGVDHLVNGKSAGAVSLGKSAPVSSLGENPKGRVWIGTMGNGLWYGKAGTFKEFPDPDLRAANVLGTTTDAAGDIWVGTSNGLYHYDSAFRRKEILLPASRVTALLVDTHGLLWAGTDGLGLGRYANGKLTMLRKSDGLGGDEISAIHEDAEGSVWVGTSGGLNQLTDVRFPIFSSKEGLLPGPAFAVAAAPKGGLWVATLYGSTFFNGRTLYNYPERNPNVNNPRRLIAATDGYVYFGDRAKNIRVYSPRGEETIYPAASWVEAFTEDKLGVIAGLGPRLMRISGGQLQPYHFRDEATVLDWIYSLCASSDGAIWVGTNHGIFRIKDGDYREWTTPEGLLTNQVDSVTEDAEGNIWAGNLGDPQDKVRQADARRGGQRPFR